MDVLMPQLGETVAEGKITKWFKSAGEPVQPGDNLFEIETDKVSMEVPSTTTGVLREIRVAAGEVAPGGAVGAGIAGGSGAAGKPAANGAAGKAARSSGCAASASRTGTPRRAPRTARRKARRDAADQARSVLRGAHARPQFRPCASSGRHYGDAAGAPACR